MLNRLRRQCSFSLWGTTAVAFEILSFHNSARYICRYTPSFIKPWYHLIPKNPELDFEVMCLVYLDTADCFVYREVPIIKLTPRTGGFDRYVSTCSTLFPHFRTFAPLHMQREIWSGIFYKTSSSRWNSLYLRGSLQFLWTF